MTLPLQLFSHYPAIPPPVPLELWESPPHQCPYLPERQATMRAFMARNLPSATYHDFMDANFRRSGNIIYQPTCAGCRECQSLRVIAADFYMSKSQRRCWRKNQDLSVALRTPEASAEKFELYRNYILTWHNREDSTFDEFCDFLYRSPVDSLEVEYRDPAGRLIAVGICDRAVHSLSSVYFYFDPTESNRSLGTFGALWEIQWAAREGIAHYYLGYWVADCPAMRYKASFRPHQILGADGVWRNHEQFCEWRTTP